MLEGGVHVVDARDGYALDLPAGWSIAQDPAHPGVLAVTGAVGPPPSGPLQVNAAGTFGLGASLVAHAPTPRVIPQGINVIVTDAPGARPEDVDEVVDPGRQDVQRLGGSVTGVRSVSVGGLPARRLDVQWPPVQGISTAGSVLVVINDERLYRISTGRLADDPTTTADAVLSSLHLFPGTHTAG